MTQENPFDDPEFGKPSGVLRKAADLPLGFASGALGATKALSDAFGADNAVSRGFKSAGEGVDSLLTPEAKAAQRRQGEILNEAKGKGFGGQVLAGGKAFMEAPVQTAVQGLGSVAPLLAAQFIPGVGQSATAARMAQVGMGLGMGAGAVKGSISDEVQGRELAAGKTPEQAASAADAAQAYSGPNADQIALGAGLGVADAALGVTPMATKMLRQALAKNVARESAGGAAEGIFASGVKGVVKEVPTEFAQGTQEQVAANIAAQRSGYEAGTFDGAFSQGAMEALASAGPGVGFGMAGRSRGTTPTPAAESDAEQQAPVTDPPAAPSFGMTKPVLNERALYAAGVAPPAMLDADRIDAMVDLGSVAPGDGELIAQEAAGGVQRTFDPRSGLGPTRPLGLVPEPSGIPFQEPAPKPFGQDFVLPEQRPSQAMGLDAKAGPLSASAVVAVDSGASPAVVGGLGLQRRTAEPVDVQPIAAAVGQIGTPRRLGETPVIDVVAREVPDQRAIPSARRLPDDQGSTAGAPQSIALPAPTNLREGLARIRAQREQAARMARQVQQPTQGALNGPQTYQTQQAETQQPQTQPAAGVALGAQVNTGQGMAAPEQRQANLARLKERAMAGQVSDGGSAAEGRMPSVAAGGDIRGLDVAEQAWLGKTLSEREKLVTDTGLKGIFALRMAEKQWGRVPEKVRQKLAVVLAPKDASPPTAPTPEAWEKFGDDTGTMNVPRAEMPQVKAAHRGAMTNFLNARGVGHEEVEVDPSTLKPTQAEFSPEKVTAAKGAGGDRAILISSDDHIIDGHHQAVAKLEAGEPVKAIRLDAPAAELLPLVKAFPSSTVDTSSDAAGQPEPQGVLTGFGQHGKPLSEGGKPFKTKAQADAARKLQPMMRVKREGKGFVLVEKSPAQIAAQEKAARRNLGAVGAGDGPLSAHEFIASQGGLSKAAMADLGFDRNVRVGARWLFTNTGKTPEGMTEALQQNGYMQGTDQNQAIELVKRSANGQPQYTADGWGQIAQAEAQTRFEDHLTAQQESAMADEDFDPFSPEAIAGDFEGDDMVVAGYDAANDPIKQEVNALLSQAEALGIDSDTIRELAYEDTRNESEQAYYERVRDDLTRAINKGTGGRSNQEADRNGGEGRWQDAQRGIGSDRGQDDGGQSAPGANSEGLTAYTPSEAAARQEAADKAERQKEAADRAAQVQAQKDDERKRIAQASIAASDTFELGQDPMDSLTGQRSVFDAAPVKPKPADPALDPDRIQKMAKGAARLAAIDAKNRAEYKAGSAERKAARQAVGEPDWTIFEGVDVLRLKGSKFVAVPNSGRKNAARFDIIDVTARDDVVAQVGSSDVRSWLTRAAVAEKDAAPRAFTTADVARATGEAKEAIISAIDAMPAQQAQKIAAGFFPAMGHPRVLGKKAIKATITDKPLNLMAAADEFGVKLSTDAKAALQAEFEGRVVAGADAASDIAQPSSKESAEGQKDSENLMLNTAEAEKLMEWQDMGQTGGVKTHALYFYESQADKDAKRGRMTLVNVTKGDRSTTGWMVDGEDQKYGVLGMAKKRAMEVGMAKAKEQGFVQMSALEQALGADATTRRKSNKVAKLRAEAERLSKEARDMLGGIVPGQPVMSTRDRNLRERSGEKMRKAADLNAQADALDAERQAATTPPQQAQEQAAERQVTLTVENVLAEVEAVKANGRDAVYRELARIRGLSPSVFNGVANSLTGSFTAPSGAEWSQETLTDFIMSVKKASADMTRSEMVQKGRDDFAAGVERQTGVKAAGHRFSEWIEGWNEAKSDAEAKASGKIAVPSDFPLKEVSGSYSGISHSGASRAVSDRDAFVERVQSLYEEAKEMVKTDAQQVALDMAIQTYKDEYITQTLSLARVRSGAYSGFVAGRANLNTRQADSRNNALDKAIDRFTEWEKVAAPKVKQAVRNARTPDEIAQDQASKAAAQEEKSEKRKRSEMDLMRKILEAKNSGEQVEISGVIVTKVSNDKEGYPLTLTIKAKDGSPLMDDKLNLATVIFGKRGIEGLRQGKEKIRALVDAIRAESSQDAAPEPAKPASKTPTVDRHAALMDAVRTGKATPEQFKAGFEAVVSGADAIKAELATNTKADLLTMGGPYMRMRYANETKPEIVDALYREMLGEFLLGESLTYGMGKNSYRDAIAKRVETVDADKLAKYVEERKAAIEEAAARRVASAMAIADPKTLDDFKAAIRAAMMDGKTRKEAFLTLTPEQRIKFDELDAESTREARETRKRAQKTQVQAAGQATGGQIIETKHTKAGYDLFVVQLSDRLSREDYTTVLASAKRLGGWYSAYRGGGAVAGFQFKEKVGAEAFLKLAGGDTTAAQDRAAQRRDAFEDDRSQSAAERLTEMADKLETQADEELGRDRKVNTARRARFAASAEAAASNVKALAKTMRNIAAAIGEGRAKFLDAVRQKTQVEALASMVNTAKYNELVARFPGYADREKRRGEPPTIETADFAEFPTFSAFRSDLASLARQMLEVDGTKKLGQQLMSVADDVSDAYLDFAKKNLHLVSTFKLKNGSGAIFSSKETGANAIRRSGLTGKAILLPVKRGENVVVMSPSEAMNRGVWKGEGDKRITLTKEAGMELVQAIGRKGNQTNGLKVPWQFENAADRLKALSRMGIETPAEFRSALREFISLRVQAQEADRVKAMERAMVGRKADGLDFFPTPAEVADQMVEAAGIEPDMAVLEPSAGMGHLADRIRAAGAEPDVVELSGDRRELLEEKGFTVVGNDFMQMKPRSFFTYGDVFRAPDGTEGVMRGAGSMGSDRVRLVNESGDMVGAGYYNRSELEGLRHQGTESGYDRIIMNPPFGDRRDAEHVRHAYSLLKPGGRLVAIMGEGVFFGKDKKAEEFREWLDSLDGTSEKLPEGSFMDPSLPVTTGVNARMVVIDKPAEAGNVAMFSRSTPSEDERRALEALSANDELFALPRPTADNVEAIAAEIDPEIKVEQVKAEPGVKQKYKLTMPGGEVGYLYVRAPNPYGPTIYAFDLDNGKMTNKVEERPGDNPDDVDPDIEDVYIDVSRLTEGGGGNEVYAIAGAFAHSTGRMFIGDPAGLSDEAMRRRPEAMLSLALKYGTTDFMAPHPRQMRGDARLKMPGLKWVYGDSVGNIERLVELNVKALDNAFPDTAKVLFDERTGSFVNADSGKVIGLQFLGARLARLRSGGASEARTALAGRKTVARGAVWRALLRQSRETAGGADGGRNGLLAGLARIAAQSNPATKGLFSRSIAGRGLAQAQAQQIVDAIKARWANAPEVVVLADMQDVKAPQAVRDHDAQQRSQGAEGEPEGFWYKGKAYIVSSALSNPSDVARVLFHEALGHYGLRGVFGDGLKPILQQIATMRRVDVRAKAEQYGLDMTKESDRLQAAEEVLAEMAETKPEIGFVKRAVAVIRAWLRKHVPGFGKMVLTDAEIISQYIMPARAFVERGGENGGLGGGARMSRGGNEATLERSDETLFSRTKEAQPEAFSVKDAAGDTLAHYRGMAMQALGRRQIVDLYGDLLPELNDYDRLVQRMDADKNESSAEADKLVNEWSGLDERSLKGFGAAKHPGMERKLAELMHDATLAGIDPDKKAPSTGWTDDMYRSHDELKARFDLLSPKAQEVYRNARDMYLAHFKKVRDAIRDRIERSSLDTSSKAKMLAKLDTELFSKLGGVYFPLARFGKYVVVSKNDVDETMAVSRAETLAEANKLRRTMMANSPKGVTVSRVYKDAEFNASRDAVGKGFVADLMGVLQQSGVEEGVLDAVGQLYLSSLPDLSWAKHGLHRKGTPGFSQDARRAFAQNMFHGARYLAKVRYADRLTDTLMDMESRIKDQKDDEGFDPVKAQQVVDEMNARHETLMNPKTSSLSTALTSVGFVWFLGISPASALVNLSQTALVAYPVMAAKWGFQKAGAALLSASAEVVRAGNDLSKVLKGDELAAFQQAVDDGTIDVTQAHDLAGVAQGEDERVAMAMRPVMRAASFMFHHAEKFNRQATFIAAYRLAKESGVDANAAFEQAKKATYDGHFDYSASNRPRLMQGNWQKVLFLFKQYGQNMVYTLTRQAYLSMKGMTPEQKTEARKQLGGLLAMHAMAAGTLGLPLVGMLLSAASMLGSDDDEPWDAEVALKNMMANAMGPKAAEVIAHGLSRLTPWDLSGRVALNKLILPDIQEGLEGQPLWEKMVTAAAGPVAGIGGGFFKGMAEVAQGQYQRGLESMLPVALKNPVKAIRFGEEGVVDKTGVVIRDDVGLAGLIGQASGFRPSDVALATEGKMAIFQADKALSERRSSLVRMYAQARMSEDVDGVQDVLDQVRRFNERNPTRRITMPNLMQSVRNRQRRIDEAEQGVYLPKSRRDALDVGRFALTE